MRIDQGDRYSVAVQQHGTQAFDRALAFAVSIVPNEHSLASTFRNDRSCGGLSWEELIVDEDMPVVAND